VREALGKMAMVEPEHGEAQAAAFKDAQEQVQTLQAELAEKERLLNEILKYHNFPQTGCDLKKYLETCNELSTRGDSGVKTDSKFSSFINETHQKQPRLSQQQQPSQQIAY